MKTKTANNKKQDALSKAVKTYNEKIKANTGSYKESLLFLKHFYEFAINVFYLD